MELLHVRGKLESNKMDIKTDHVASENVFNVAKKKAKETKHRTRKTSNAKFAMQNM